MICAIPFNSVDAAGLKFIYKRSDFLSEDVLENLGFGASVGLAQLRVDTAIQYQLTPTAALVAAQLGSWTWENVSELELELRLSWLHRKGRVIRHELHNDRINITASGKIIGHMLTGRGYPANCGCRKASAWYSPEAENPGSILQAIRLAEAMGRDQNDGTPFANSEDAITEGDYAERVATQLLEWGFVTTGGRVRR